MGPGQARRLKGRERKGRHGAARRVPLARIMRTLEALYGRPSLDDHERLRPLDELILTILSQNTNDRNRDRAWASMRSRFPDWDAVASAPRRRLEEAIRPGGLAPTKSARIQEVLRRVREERGAYDLDFLETLEVEEAEGYLRRFKGVGLKTIRCVLLFSCRKSVIPVDTHILRVGKRLGIIPAKASPEQAHAHLQGATPPAEVYPFHINLITHGRRVCKAQRPRCEECALARLCDYGRAGEGPRAGR